MILWHAEFQKQCVNSPAYIIVKQEDHVARIQIVIMWMILTPCTMPSKRFSEIKLRF